METQSMRTHGTEMLVDKRGDERVTFKEVADHLADYAGRFPAEAETVDNIARFLAGIEDVDHRHEKTEIGSNA